MIVVVLQPGYNIMHIDNKISMKKYYNNFTLQIWDTAHILLQLSFRNIALAIKFNNRYTYINSG